VSCPKCGHTFVPETKAPPAPSRTGKRIILLVEDQKYFTEVTREALGSEYRTVSVATKDEALKVMATELPSLLILDLSLARGQDGRDLLKAIPNKAFPILIFTARDETELYGDAWEELKKLGADDIVHKGMNVGDELRRKVALLLGPA
jgi:DNA-binding response OmpR family regulator